MSSVDAHVLAFSRQMIRVLEQNKPRNPEIFMAQEMRKCLENWVGKITGKRIDYPLMEGGLIGLDSDATSILLQSGVDVKSVYKEMFTQGKCKSGVSGMFDWCNSDDESGEIPVVHQFDPLTAQWFSFMTNPKDRKRIIYENEGNLLLGNAIVHPTCCFTPDIVLSPGTIVGPFCWLSPKVMIGMAVTVGAHCNLNDDVVVGDFSRIESNVSLGAGCRIGECCSVGAGSVIAPGVVIGAGTVIQSGQIVKFNVGK